MVTTVGCIAFFNFKPNDHAITIKDYPVISHGTFNIESNPIFASYDEGNIYITKNQNFIPPSDKDIVIVDLRDKIADIKILSSYRITNLATQKKIIDIILNYNTSYPSSTTWTRSKQSLLFEWHIHNLAYAFCYERNRTADVDFENKEEEKYKIKIRKV